MSILTLLANYRLADESRELYAAVADAWLEDLEEFDPEIVADACRSWRQGPDYSRKPLSGDIRRLCIEALESHTLKLAKRKTMTEGEVIAAADNWARSHGHASIADMQRSPGFTRVVVQIGPGQFRDFDPVRDSGPIAVARVLAPAAPEPPPRKTPDWIVERDAKRAAERRDALGLEKLDAMVDALVARQQAMKPEAEPPTADRR